MKETQLVISSVQSLSHVQLFVTPWTAARQASLSITSSQSLFKVMSIKKKKKRKKSCPSTCCLVTKSYLTLFVTPWTVALLSLGFSRQEYWSGLPFPSQRIFSTLLHKVKASAAQPCQILCAPWIVACQAPLSMGFSRQEYCSGLPFPVWGTRKASLDRGIKHTPPALNFSPLSYQGSPEFVILI